jgi:membrane-bound lytic murein transglycosylase B
MRYLLKLSLIFLVIPIFFFSIANANPQLANADPEPEYNDRVQQLINYFETKNLDLKTHLKDSRFSLYDDIGGRFRNSAEKKTPTLQEYQRILGFETKKVKIREFMETYSAELQEAEESYDIPKFVISAIIGLESNFGAVVGSYNPLNVYVSMYSEDYRADFARAQLEELLIFTNERNIDVFELKSSYAGAMAFAQFIPYSLNRWFVGDDIFDMRNNILSVANYLAHFKNITGDIQGAVFRYNPSSLYRDAVLSLADEAEIYYVSQQE